jgi:hypothetical protein
MTTDEEILTEFKKLPAFEKLGSEPFVLRIDKHTFVETEVEWHGRSFLLRLAEVLPGLNIIPQSKEQIEKQTLDFVENR